MAAARELFAERGVAGTSIGDVRERAGVSTGALYHHFASKEALHQAVVEDALGGYREAFLEALHANPGAREGVSATVAMHLAWCEAHRDLARLMLLHPPPPPSPGNRDFFAVVERWRAPHVHYGALRDLPFDLTYVLWLGPAQELTRLWLSGRTAIRPTAAEAELASGAWGALKGTA